MGEEARLQAIPENCELLKLARSERDIAERMQFFHMYNVMANPFNDPRTAFFINTVRELVQLHPGLTDRYFYGGGRHYDKVIYLLSPIRRTGQIGNDQSLINKAIRGSELLHPEAKAGQGIPIGFVPAKEVKIIADFLDKITHEQLHEHYNPAEMKKAAVYKMYYGQAGEGEFQYIWEEFAQIRNIYHQADAHNEAMITVID